MFNLKEEEQATASFNEHPHHNLSKISQLFGEGVDLVEAARGNAWKDCIKCIK